VILRLDWYFILPSALAVATGLLAFTLIRLTLAIL
jgi:hypothetical protein